MFFKPKHFFETVILSFHHTHTQLYYNFLYTTSSDHVPLTLTAVDLDVFIERIVSDVRNILKVKPG